MLLNVQATAVRGIGALGHRSSRWRSTRKEGDKYFSEIMIEHSMMRHALHKAGYLNMSLTYGSEIIVAPSVIWAECMLPYVQATAVSKGHMNAGGSELKVALSTTRSICVLG